MSVFLLDESKKCVKMTFFCQELYTIDNFLITNEPGLSNRQTTCCFCLTHLVCHQ